MAIWRERILMKAKHLAASMLALICLSATAQQAELKVIVTAEPAACTPTFSGGSTLDFGDVKSSRLSATEFTHIGSRDTQLTLACTSGPARLALRAAVDNRAASRVPGMAAFLGPLLGIPSGVGDIHGFGLGKVDGLNVGSYIIGIPAIGATGDGVAVDQIRSRDGGATAWVKNASGGLLTTESTRWESWAVPGTLTPAARTMIVQPLSVAVGINKTGDLPALTRRIPLDGLVTFRIEYL